VLGDGGELLVQLPRPFGWGGKALCAQLAWTLLVMAAKSRTILEVARARHSSW
jgi:hypothetical protein